MDNAKKINIDNLKRCIMDLSIDMPLYLNNQKQAIKFDFEKYDDKTTKTVVKEILQLLFENTYFWVCEYGGNSSRTYCEKKLIKAKIKDVMTIPYISSIDPEDFEYPNNSITCIHISMSEFDLESYTKYVMSSDFISNTIFLIDDERYIAVNMYDRRGMDIATVDRQILKGLYAKYDKYISEYYLNNILEIVKS